MERAHRDTISLLHLISEHVKSNHFGIPEYGAQFTVSYCII